MRSIRLFLALVYVISKSKSEVKSNKLVESEVKYVGPIVYSDEKPPIVYFPTPPTTSSAQTINFNKQNISLNENNVEYVPFPYQELPVLIYKSKQNPPIHVVSQTKQIDESNQSNNSLIIDKRLGETASGGNPRGGRALKWSNFKLFNDIPLVMKTQKWPNTENNAFNSMSTQLIDMNNNLSLSSGNIPLSLANAPHVVYSGHPPIHVFPQPIIIKEPELTKMSTKSDPFQKNRNSGDTSMSASNKHEITAIPTQSSSQFYAYGGTPLGSGSAKSYGFRVKTRGNKQDTDYSSSHNYENYDDSYSPQHSDGSSDSQSEDKTKFRPTSQYSNSINSDSNDEQFDKDYERPIESFSREKSREKYPKYWNDFDSDNGWLSSLMGYNRWPTRSRRPLTLSIVNSPTNEQLVFATSATNPMDMENMALMNPHLRHNGWITGINGVRPTASALRPVYSLSNLFGYRRPHIPPPPNPYYARFNPGLAHAGTSMAPVALKQMGFGPPVMSLPSVPYQMRLPFSPFMMYGYRRPPMGPSGDLAFAESNRNTSYAKNNKRVKLKDNIQMSGSHFKPSIVMPSAIPTIPSITMSASAQNKPPIIIYQGLRPPVHVYKQPNHTTKQNSEIPFNSIPVFNALHESKNQIHESGAGAGGTTTTSTQSPYYQFFSTEEPNDFYDKNYKTSSALYISENSAFSPRLVNDDWIPVKQTITNLKDSDLKA